MKDNKTISNEEHEVLTAAMACGVKQLSIHVAKNELKSGDRAEVYAWIKKNKGKIVLVTIE